MEIKPTRGRVLVKIETAEPTTSSGIIIPETSQREEKTRGEVVCVGEPKTVDGKIVDPEVRPGDIVIIDRWGGTEVEVEGEEYRIVESTNIVAIITN